MSDNNSKIKSYKEEIRKLQLEIENEKKNRFNYSLKGDNASLNQSIEREGRINTKIRDLENKIYELEAPALRKEAEIKNKEKEILKQKTSLPNLVNHKIYQPSINYKEQYAIILDYLPKGYPEPYKHSGKPIAQAIGIDQFILFELAPKKDIDLEIGEVVYIGKGKRHKIYRVLGKIDVENLTRMSRLEIDNAIYDIVDAHEERYIKYFNNAGSISLKLHGLGLLTGINGKMVENLLKERNKRKFDSYNDIKNRVPSVKDPQRNITNKIKEELKLTPQKKKHHIRIFTIPPNKNSKKRRR